VRGPSPLSAIIFAVLGAFLLVSALALGILGSFAYIAVASVGMFFIAAALIAPLATCMGMIFPTGIRILTSIELGELVPWMWGANGLAAVVASVLGMMVATAFGFTAALLLAALAYVLTLASTRALETHPKGMRIG